MTLQLLLASVTALCVLAGNFLVEAAFYHRERSANMENLLPSADRSPDISRTFYGIMFDAGSTGTRIHIYTFIQKDDGKPDPRPTS